MNIGATFRKFDLHLHAPGIGQYFKMPPYEPLPQTPAERLDFARRYIRQAREQAGLDLIAITNHNDTSWVEPLRQAAQELYPDFVVLPGLEVGADSGKVSIHVLAIFPEDTPVEILERFLDDDLGLPSEKRFAGENSPCPSPRSFIDVVEAIGRRGGIAIAAHAFSAEDSLLGSSSNEGLSRKAQFRHPDLLGLHINKGKIEELDKWQRLVVTNQHKDLGFRRERPIACLNCSDARRLEDIGQWYTYVKCEQLGFQALYQALLDPEARLHLRDDPPPKPACRLESLTVVSSPTGFLRGLQLTFNPRLNCLIGGRGTGKSAIVELLRYLWEQDPLRPTEITGFADVFLPETAEATVEIIKDQTRYCLRRCGREPTRVERCEPDGTPLPVATLRPHDIFPLHIYGQKEVLYTSEDVRSQLDLLDRLVGEPVERLKQERDDLLLRLRRNREAIVGLFEQIGQRERRLEGKGRIEEQLRQYHQSGLGEMAATKRLYDREAQAWEVALAQVGGAEQSLLAAQAQAQLDLGYLSEENLAHLPNRENLNALRTQLEQFVVNLKQQLAQAQQLVDPARDGIVAGRSEWEQKRDIFDREYQRELAKQPGMTPDTVTRLDRERLQMEAVEREVQQIQGKVRKHIEERQNLLRRLLNNNLGQFNVRQAKAEEISARLPRVHLQVIRAGDTDWMVEQLRRFLSGSRLREEDYRNIASTAVPTPLALLAAVEAADPEMPPDLKTYAEWLPDCSPAHLQLSLDPFPSHPLQKLGRLCSLDSTKAAKLPEYLPLLRRLEMDELQPPDRVTIELNIARQENEVLWRELGQHLGEGVSVGQGCTAILSIILLESQNPLIIDQPEDDLDNRFIFDEVVRILRQERGRRQMLLATHNANIPVAGDAEQIIALDVEEEKSPGGRTDLRCNTVASGFVDTSAVKDQVTIILEGGVRAFQLRKQKYGF